MTNDWDSERLARHKLEILVALKDGAMPEDVPDGAAGTILDFWEDPAALVRAGHVDRALVYQTFRACRIWWIRLAPYTRRVRVESNVLGAGEDFEWLAGVMADMERKAGVTSEVCRRGKLASTLDCTFRVPAARSGLRRSCAL